MSSLEPVISAAKRAILLQSAPTSHRRSAKTVRRKVSTDIQSFILSIERLIEPSGHKALVCKENRVLDLSKVANKSPDDAWDALKVADASRDLDDFREVRCYPWRTSSPKTSEKTADSLHTI